MKVLIAILAFSAALVAAALAAPPAGPATVTFSARMGETTFPHALHQQLKIACETCHHTGIEPAPRCATCHGPQENAPELKDAFHRQCVGCHHEREAGPRGCRDCHRKP
ncbi:MAG: cytochrome c3 family protein [Desulfuromonadales bacterium]|nr:cytochrome c3 family protein [Desulfuromonadales bacterium]